MELSTALILSTAMSAIGTGVSAFGSYQQGQYQAALSRQSALYTQQMAQRNKAMADFQAAQTRKAGLEQGSLIQDRAKQLLGKQIAGYGAAGVTSEGSPLEVMGQTMGEYERDTHNAILNANYNAWRTTQAGETSLLQGEAEASRYNAEADAYASRGNIALYTAPLVMGTSILTGYSRYLTATKSGGGTYGNSMVYDSGV